jgi:hypothetical protein
MPSNVHVPTFLPFGLLLIVGILLWDSALPYHGVALLPDIFTMVQPVFSHWQLIPDAGNEGCKDIGAGKAVGDYE